jgi:hypothetical protein
MKLIGNSFRDVVTGEIVRYWIDCYGTRWLAVSKYGFRVNLDEINQEL